MSNILKGIQLSESQINEADPRNFDSDVDYYAAQNAPAKPRYRGTQSPGVNPDDEDYFREIFRKKREAAKKAEQDKEQGVAEGKPEQPEADYGDDYQNTVKRVGQKAKEQEKKKPVDMAALARRLNKPEKK